MTPEETKDGIPIYVSQADIDEALSSKTESEDSDMIVLDETDVIANGDESTSSGAGDLDFFGLLSSKDIEAMLHGADENTEDATAQNEVDQLMEKVLSEDVPAASAPTDQAPEETDGTVSQNDIDDLLKSLDVDSSEDATPGSSPAEAVTGETDGAVSQNDIDDLLKGLDVDSSEDATPGSSPAEAVSGETDGAVSQNDIDDLLKGLDVDSSEDATSASRPDEAAETVTGETDGTVSQSDIDALLKGADLDVDGSEEEAPTSLDASKTDTDEGAISQDDIDALFNTSFDDDDEAIVAEDTGAIEPVPDVPEEDGTSMISQDDLDKLLTGAIESELPDSEESIVPFDAASPEVTEKTSAGEHISQADLDRLLQESLAEDDVDEGIDEKGEEALAPVILAADDPLSEVPAASPSDERSIVHKEKRPAWYQKKVLMMAVAAAFIFVVIGSTLLIRKDPPQPVARVPQVLTFPVPQTDEAIPVILASQTTISLPGFLVLAPFAQTETTYVSADLILDVTDVTTATRIKENEAIVRNIIYGVMHQAVMADDMSNVTEVHMTLAIRKALGAFIPRETIGQIYFHKFTMA